jgi:hypothetical protein
VRVAGRAATSYNRLRLIHFHKLIRFFAVFRWNRLTAGVFGVGATRLGCSSKIGLLRPKPLQDQISLTLAVYALS